MTSYITFRVFLVCLILCALMVLFAIWFGQDNALGPTYFKATASLFVLGLASFLIWFSLTLRAIFELLKSPR